MNKKNIISFILIYLLTTASIFFIGCRKVDVVVPSVQPVTKEFFANQMNTVSNGDSINFTLQTAGIYTLTMIDTIQNQVVTREKFTGKTGMNSLNIYTKTLTQTYLSVVLMDNNNNQINKTKITIK
jgi:hypothetical protein